MTKASKWLVAALIGLATVCPAWAGLAEGVAAYERGNYKAALKEFLPAAESGSPVAQFYLGEMHDRGEGLPEDEKEAALWYRKAAEQSYMPAQMALGYFYASGRGVNQSDGQALVWFREPAEKGNPVAQYNLGLMFDGGQGVAKNASTALGWYRKAAEQGMAKAQFNLGKMLLGYEVPPDRGPLEQVCDGQGCRLSKDSLRLIADEQIRRNSKDERQAAAWFRRAAEQGHVDAQVALGVLHGSGRGVPKNEQEAVAWYRKAAEQGSASGQFNLGVMYDTGRGVPKDLQQAYFWWLLAASNGSGDARNNRDIAEVDLTLAQRAEAQAAARGWRPKTAATSKRPSATREGEQGVSPDSTGSGFQVATGRVVTNHHVTEGCGRLRVDGQSEGRLLGSDPRNDLALIALRSGSLNVATMRAGSVKVGESATVVGFPLSGLLSGFNVTTGIVSSLAGIGGDTRMVQITAPVQPGNSGGPLLDAGGKVMGVVVSKLNALKVAQSTGDVPQNVNFAINANVLVSFLDANGVDYKAAPIGPAISTQEIARRAQAFTVLVECWK